MNNGPEEFKKWSRLFLRWWWLFILSGLGAGVAAYTLGVLSGPTPVYASTAKVIVERRSQEPGVPFGVDMVQSEMLSDTYVQLISLRPVMEVIAQQLPLGHDPDELARRINVRNRFGVGQPTNIIHITVRDPDPILAATIANVTAQTFISISLDRQAAQIAQLEERLSQYPTAQSAIVLSGQAQAPTLDVSIVEPAVPSNSPTNSPFATILATTAVATILGLVITGLFIIFREYFDDRLKSTEEFKQAAGLSLVAPIPRSSGRNGTTVQFPGTGHQIDPFTESYHFLMTNLNFVSHHVKGIKSILVTGSGVSEGKSTTAVNLAIAAAAEGMSVILVDCDLRRPSLHRIFDLEQHNGLTHLLAGGSTVEEELVASPIKGLKLLLGGPVVLEPGAALASPNLNWVVEEMEKHADLVIFDSPALLAVPDALRLATLVDGVLLVVDASRTTREMVEKAAGRLRQVGANIVAGVFNRASVDQDIYKYARHYQINEKSLTNGFSSKLP